MELLHFNLLPKKITLVNESFFELMSMVQQCQYHGYEITDWDKRHTTFLGFITAITYTIIMELKKGDALNIGSILPSKLQSALEREDYEEASRIRDLINRPFLQRRTPGFYSRNRSGFI